MTPQEEATEAVKQARRTFAINAKYAENLIDVIDDEYAGYPELPKPKHHLAAMSVVTAMRTADYTEVCAKSLINIAIHLDRIATALETR